MKQEIQEEIENYRDLIKFHEDSIKRLNKQISDRQSLIEKLERKNNDFS